MDFRQFRSYFKDEDAFLAWMRKPEIDPQTLRKNLLAAEEAAKEKPQTPEDLLRETEELVAKLDAER